MDALKKALLESTARQGWKRVGIRPHHGINLLLSSLHSASSCGIGEFYDLIPLIDWCADLGMDIIQLLPLNHLEKDASPYNAFSSCALNFLHLSLHALPHLEEEPRLRDQLKTMTALNHTKRVAVLDVFTRKTHWLQAYLDNMGHKIASAKHFKEYVRDNAWVEHYALFRVLHEHLDASPENWPLEIRSLESKTFKELLEKYQKPIQFYISLQYLCFLQLTHIKEYAHQKGVFLMGDLPILLSPNSVDVWQYPHLFVKHLQAGAPPDIYNEEGQNWKFPLFNWDAMRQTHFHWWKQRLAYAEQLYDLFRIDHVLGFFRIWAIPPEHPSKEGYFIPVDEKQWEPQGTELLEKICAFTSMLPIAEDLGLVQEMVRPCLKHLGICGTKVMRWERRWETKNKCFIPVQEYEPISLTCVSTHDAEPLGLWWTTFPEEARDFAAFKQWPYTPELTLQQREEILWDSHHSSSLFHVNLLQEYLALFPELVHQDPEEERINIPGTTLPTNWTYRCIPSVEDIVAHQELFKKMHRIVN